MPSRTSLSSPASEAFPSKCLYAVAEQFLRHAALTKHLSRVRVRRRPGRVLIAAAEQLLTVARQRPIRLVM